MRSSFTKTDRKKIIPDTLSDQTSAHDPLIGYIPHTLNNEQANVLREKDPEGYLKLSYESMYLHVKLMIDLMHKGAITLTMVTISVQERMNTKRRLIPNYRPWIAFLFPDLYLHIYDRFSAKAKVRFRWAALSGDPNDIAVTDEVIKDLFPHNKSLMRWLKLAKEKIAFQGLPARICWLGQGEREKAGLAFNELVRSGKGKGSDRNWKRSLRYRECSITKQGNRKHVRW
jgi:urocanate hydratase